MGIASRPPVEGGWVPVDEYGGWMAHVEQGHYGHRARKATWLYAVDTIRPALKWGPAQSGARLDAGFHSKEERAAAVAAGWKQPEGRLTKQEALETPIPFRDLLVRMVREAPR